MKDDLKITRLFLAGIFFSSLIFSPFVLDLTLVPRFISLAGFLSIALYFLYTGKEVLHVKADPIVLLYAAYVLFTALSISWAQNKSEAWFEICKQVLAFATFLVTAWCLKKQPAYFMQWLLKGSVLLFGIAFLAGCAQLSGIKSLSGDALYAITGINGHKNLYASFLFINLFFLMKARRELTGTWKTAALACIVLNIALLIFLRTKAVWLGGLVAGMVYFAFKMFRSKKTVSGILVPGLFLLATLLFFFTGLQPAIRSGLYTLGQLNTKNPGTAAFSNEQERLLLWDKTETLIQHHKMLGAGAGNWQVNFPDATLRGLYRAEDLSYTFQRPHNDFLWILSETGMIGFTLFLLFLVALLWFLVSSRRQIVDNWIRTNLLLLLAFICGYFTIAFFDFPKERMEHTLWINILLGFVYYQVKAYGSLPVLKTLPVNKIASRLSLGLLAFIFVTGLLRYKGEYYTRKLYDAKNSGDVAGILKNGKAAWSVFYTLDPVSVPVNWYIANACASMGNYIDAHAYFLKAYKENPYNRNVLNDLASSYVFNQDAALAKKYYHEAARISPRFDDPKLNLAAVYIKEQNFKLAKACLDSVFHDSKRRESYQRIVDLNK